MLIFLFIIIFIIVLFYLYICMNYRKEVWELKDVVNNTSTRIRGDYVDITCNGVTERIAKGDEGGWYRINGNKKSELPYESVFPIAGREFVLVRTEKGNGFLVLIPLIITMITIMALSCQTYTLINKKESTEVNKIDESNADNVETNSTDGKSAITEDEVSNKMKEGEKIQTSESELTDNIELDKDAQLIVENESDLQEENKGIDWESFQTGEKLRRNLINNPSEVGIQVSKHHKDIEWDKVKADGIDYAIIQAGSRGSETGRLIEDSYFSQNIAKATANGIKVGVSFHSQAINREEIDAEIELIMKSITGYNVEYPIGITLWRQEDCRTRELTFDEYVDLIIYFCTSIEERGYTPMIMGEAIWFDQFTNEETFDKYLKMVYDPNKPPSNINNCIIWIYSADSKKMVDGINENMDVAISLSAYVNKKER